MMVAPADGGCQGRLRSLSLASLGDSPAVRRDAPPKSGGEGAAVCPLEAGSARGETGLLGNVVHVDNDLT
jgi:hypothetical protein